MSITNVLAISKFPFKYFYSCINDKEYIFYANEKMQTGNCVYIEQRGKLILDTLNNSSNILKIIKKYIVLVNDISYKNSNDDDILNLLQLLHKELSNTDCKFLSYIDFETLYAKQYKEICELINLQKENIVEIEQEMKKENINKVTEKNLKARKNASYTELIYLHKENTFKKFVFNELEKLYKKIENFKKLYSHISFNENFNFDKKDFKIIEENKEVFEFYSINSYNKFVHFDKERIVFDLENAIYNNNSTNYKLIQCFEFDYIMDLINISFAQCLNSKTYINCCKNCGKYFLPSVKNNEKYCDNISPQKSNKTCKEIGAKETFKYKIKLGKIEHEYNNTKSCLLMRIRRAEEKGQEKKKEIANKKYIKFMEQFQIQNKKYNTNKITENEFVKWIISQKDLTKKKSN